MEYIINFLQELSIHNNRKWFNAHKAEYLKAYTMFNKFSEQFISSVSKFDHLMQGVAIKDCTFQIYQDMRYSKDKQPYHTRFSVYACPYGKKSRYAGYYIHIQPDTNSFLLYSGLHNPTSIVSKNIRDEISENGKQFHAALVSCHDFRLPWEKAFKKVPKGYNSDDIYADYYRLRSYEILKAITLDEVLDVHFLDNVLTDFERTYNYNSLLNKCVEYTK